MTVLSVRNLSVSYSSHDSEMQAVDDCSLDLAEKEILCLVGESGCGKSTAGMAMLGLLPSTANVSGSVVLGGQDLLKLRGRELTEVRGRSMAYIFQEPTTSLNPIMTVGKQITEVLQRHEGMGRAQATARAIELLELVEIPSARSRLGSYPFEMSGGMLQRVMIAMAVACGPQVLIADEPTTALDVTVQAGILDLFRSMREELGLSIIVITHDLGVVADIADRVAVMYGGRLVEGGSVYEVFRDPAHPYAHELLRAVPREATGKIARLQEIPGRVPTLSAPAEECSFAPRCRWVEEKCQLNRPELEQFGNGREVACFRSEELMERKWV